MGWAGRLQLDYRRDGERTVGHDLHHGPLRVLQRLYPEGDAVCHQVLVHPPGGLVGGDTLDLHITLNAEAHALITTPGAARFYRSAGEWAEQHVQARLEEGARLEWLPLETLAYRQCRGRNRMSFELAPGAQMMGWDVLALGLPAAGQAFDQGQFHQHLELPGEWLERGLIDGCDERLLSSPLGFGGHSVLATLWLAQGHELGRERREALLELARAQVADHSDSVSAGVTSPRSGLVVLRALGHRVEPVMALLQTVWAAWRQAHWGLSPCPPRIWKM